MTIAKLIQELQTRPQNAPVLVFDGDKYRDASRVSEDMVAPKTAYGDWPKFQSAKLADRNTVHAVIID